MLCYVAGWKVRLADSKVSQLVMVPGTYVA